MKKNNQVSRIPIGLDSAERKILWNLTKTNLKANKMFMKKKSQVKVKRNKAKKLKKIIEENNHLLKMRNKLQRRNKSPLVQEKKDKIKWCRKQTLQNYVHSVKGGIVLNSVTGSAIKAIMNFAMKDSKIKRKSDLLYMRLNN